MYFYIIAKSLGNSFGSTMRKSFEQAHYPIFSLILIFIKLQNIFIYYSLELSYQLLYYILAIYCKFMENFFA